MNTKNFIVSLFSVVCPISATMALQATLLHTDCTQANICVIADTPEQELKITVKDIASGKEREISKDDASVLSPIEKNGRVNKIKINSLSPNTAYEYEIKGDGAKQSIKGSFKTAPDYKDKTPPPDFTFAVFGKVYENDKPFDPPFRTNGGEYEIFEKVANAKPAFAIWAGGTDTLRPTDMGSLEAILSRFVKSRTQKLAQNFLNNIPNYGVMANASFGENIADKYSPTAQNALQAFETLWTLPQKNKSGAYYSFSYSDADFFVLDCCSQRSNLDYKKHMPEILGEEQMAWLMSNLSASKANFKIIVTNVPVTNPAENSDNFTFAKKERKSLLDFLVLKKIEGVVIISANKNFAETTRLVRAGAYPLYEVTAGAFTDRPASEVSEMNYFRQPNSLIKKRSFVSVKIDGAENDRHITFAVIDSKGERQFNFTLKQSELKGAK